MAVKLDGSTAYLEHAAKIVSGFPFSMMVWASQDSGGTSQAMLSHQQSTADRHALLWLDGNGTSKYAVLRNPGNSGGATKSSAPNPTATMQLAVAVYTSTSSRTIYFGSNTGVTDTTAMIDDITNHDRLTVGAWHYNGGVAGLFLNGSVAESHLFNVALTSTDVANLLADSVKPEAVTGWVDGWMLNPSGSAGSAAPATFTSIGGTRTLTTVGTATVSSQAHPISRSSSSFAGALVLDNDTVNGSFSTVANGSFAGALVLDNDTVNGSFGSQSGVITSLPLKTNNGTVLASTALSYICFYNITTGALVLRKTGVSTNASGIFTVTDPLLGVGTQYRIDYETAAGQRRMPLATAA